MGSVADALERRNRSEYIATATTTVVKTGEGILVRVIVGQDAASGLVTLYDNTAGSGTIIAVMEATANNQVQDYEFDIPFSTGLTVVTVDAPKITIVYR
jgi:hypothetical protein